MLKLTRSLQRFGAWFYPILKGLIACVWIMGQSISPANALDCTFPKPAQETDASVYLMQIKQVDEDAKICDRRGDKGRCTWPAQMEVVKVYRGDIDELSVRTDLTIETLCNAWGGYACEAEHKLPELVQPQSYWLISEDKGFIGKAAEISLWVCPGSNIQINDPQILQAFEAKYPPLWIRE